MDSQDRRKRAFSQAFQRMNQPRLGDNNSQPAKRILSYPLGSRGLCQQDANLEDEVPLDLGYASALNQIPGTQIRHSPPIGLQYSRPTFNEYASLASLQHDIYGNGPGPELTSSTDGPPPPIMRNRCCEGPVLRESPLSTPSVVRGQSMFGPSPYVRSDSSPYVGDIVDVYAQSGDSPMSDAKTAAGPLTPTALNFSHLSLNSQGYSLPPSSLRQSCQGNRTTVRDVPISAFASHFAEINPNEIIVLFDQGKEARKVDKYPLCNLSRFFAQLLHSPFLGQNLTRCICLHDDFPYAITIMLHFIESGHYVFDQRAFAKFPLLTTLDFHIHTYLVSSKYSIVALQDCAIKAYLGIAQYEIELGFLAPSNGQPFDLHIAMPGFPVMAPADEHADKETMIMPIDRFLNSLVLLWKNTRSRHDAMRKAVLELIKHHLNRLLKVPLFVTLMGEMAGFGDDVVASLRDDGFEVRAFQVVLGGRQMKHIRFGV